VLTVEHYGVLSNRLGRPEKEIRQTNHYFDTPDATLGRSGVLIRIREEDSEKIVLTIKQGGQVANGLYKSVETEWLLNNIELVRYQRDPALLRPLLDRAEIGLRQIQWEEVRYLGAAVNLRRCYPQPEDWEIILDATQFPGETMDYELEAEVPSPDGFWPPLEDVLQRAQVPRISQTKTKYERFLIALSHRTRSG